MEVLAQLETLEKFPVTFEEQANVPDGLSALTMSIVQMNLGKLCNQACLHCHVDASPIRTELMDRQTADICLEIIKNSPGVETVDLTGGAPEMNPNFRYLVEETRKAGIDVIDRCNLTILEEPGYEYLYDFLSGHKVEIVASLPHYAQDRTDRQRGKGVFDKSMIALQKLNELGYGEVLPLNLVYNPSGFFLAASQQELEREFKENLLRNYNIRFNNLYCINNLPINRFLATLVQREKFEDYMELLAGAFNPATVEGLMCRHQISIGYDGSIYDCDFNQMLEMKVNPVSHVREFDLEKFLGRTVRTENHCYGCTAGAGSSCGGQLT